MRPFKKKRKQRAGCLPQNAILLCGKSWVRKVRIWEVDTKGSEVQLKVVGYFFRKASLGYMSLSQGKRKEGLEIQLSNGGFA